MGLYYTQGVSTPKNLASSLAYFLAFSLSSALAQDVNPEALVAAAPSPSPIPMKKKLPPMTPGFGRLYRDDSRGRLPEPMPSFGPALEVLSGQAPHYSWMPDCPAKPETPKKKSCRDDEVPVTNQDPDSEILELTGTLQLKVLPAATQGVRIEVNGKKAENIDDFNDDVKADVRMHGFFTSVRIDLIPDPKMISAANRKKWEDEKAKIEEENAQPGAQKKAVPARPTAQPPFAEPQRFYYVLVFPEWEEMEEAHVGQLTNPRIGVFRPHIGFTTTSFTQQNAPPISNLALAAGLDYVRRGLWKPQSIVKMNFVYSGLPALGSSEAAIVSDVTIKTMDLSVLAGWSLKPPGSRLTVNALGGLWLGHSSVTEDISGYKSLLWPQLQGEVGYYLTSRQKIQGEGAVAISNEGLLKPNFKYMRFSVMGAYIWRLPSKWQLNLSAGFSSVHFGTFLGDFTGTQIKAQGGIDYRW